MTTEPSRRPPDFLGPIVLVIVLAIAGVVISAALVGVVAYVARVLA